MYKNNDNKNVQLVHYWNENVFGKKLHPFYTEIIRIEKYKDYKKIVIVRNPYDRFVSAFNFFKPAICSCYNISSIEEYADKCFDNTQKNKSLVNACMSVEEVNAIDITAGYHDKLNFE